MYSGDANSVERGHRGMANDGSQQRKPDFRTALEDVKALATVLVMQIESGLGRRLTLRSPAVFLIVGVAATLIVTSAVVLALVAGGHALSDNAALIGAVVALGGVFTAQLVGIALEDVRTREARELETRRARGCFAEVLRGCGRIADREAAAPGWSEG
jgi:hypothetical protein